MITLLGLQIQDQHKREVVLPLLQEIYEKVQKAKDSSKVKELYISYCKLMLIMYESPLEDTKWGNCYTHALGLNCPRFFEQRYSELRLREKILGFDIGSFSGETKDKTNYLEPSLLLSYLERDCELLGMDMYPSSFDAPICHGGYKIALYIEYFFRKTSYEHPVDFHFIRQNKDGTWTEKKGLGDITKIVNNPKLSYDHGDCYKLIGVYEIVKPFVKNRILH